MKKKLNLFFMNIKFKKLITSTGYIKINLLPEI